MGRKKTDMSTFQVYGSHFTSAYETSESVEVDCKGRRTIRVIYQDCNVDDVREHGDDIAVMEGNKESILEAEERLEQALYRVQDAGQWKVRPTKEDYWYSAPIHCEDVQPGEVD